MSNGTNTDCKFLSVLLQLAPAIRWIHERQPAEVVGIPPEHLEQIKCLESIGLVYRRQPRTISVQIHRLKKLLALELQNVDPTVKTQCMSQFAGIIS